MINWIKTIINLLLSKPKDTMPEAGAYYSVKYRGKGYQIAKIIAISSKVHIRIYQNMFAERPITINIDELRLIPTLPAVQNAERTREISEVLADIVESGSNGVKHLSLTKLSFDTMKPVFIQSGTVSEEELDSYYMWKETTGIYR